MPNSAAAAVTDTLGSFERNMAFFFCSWLYDFFGMITAKHLQCALNETINICTSAVMCTVVDDLVVRPAAELSSHVAQLPSWERDALHSV